MVDGMLSSGIKIPPRKSKGNLIRFIRVITFEVVSVGTAEINNANIDPKVAISPIPKIIKTTVENEVMLAPKRIKIIAINNVIINEYKDEARSIPNKISFIDVGDIRIRSNDFSRVSMGRITGLIAVAVKKAVIEIIPTKT